MTPLLLALAMVLSAPEDVTGDRVICRFDFEEATVRPLDMPLAFEQVGHSGAGTDFPRFGEMSLTDETAYAGRFAFRFDLKGRSMAARTVPGAIPVLPRVDYRVSMHVRTRDLERAGARVVAWMQDAQGTPIEATRRVSAVLRGQADTNWQPLSLLVPGHGRAATELVVELQLVQRELQEQDGSRNLDTRPPLQDVSGVAIFDEIVIEQWPRLHLADATRIGLHQDPVPGSSPTLHLRIDDPARSTTTWTLSVEDRAGELIQTTSGPVPADGLDQAITIPLQSRDWYHVRAQVASGDRVLCQDELAFTTIPRATEHRLARRVRVDLTADDSTHDQASLATDLLGHLGAGEAVIPAWSATEDFAETWPRTLTHVDELKRMGIESMLAVNWVPPAYRDLGPFDSDEAAALLAAHPETLDPLVEAAIIAWGDSASRWRIGHGEDDPTVSEAAMTALRTRLDGLVVNMEITANDGSASAEPLEGTPREQMRLAATRLIEDWCDGLTPIAIAAPWTSGTNGMQPTPAYPAIRTLVMALADRPDITVLPSDPGLQARLLKGPDRSPIIVAWSTLPTDAPPVPLVARFPLGTKTVTAMDVLGNPVACTTGRYEHAVTVGALPVIIEGFESTTVRLLASLDVQPATLDASLRVHDHALHLENPGATALAGHLIAMKQDGVAVRPAVIGLDLSPGASLDMPIELVITTPLPEGPLPIQWEARLDTGQRIPMTTWLHVAIPDLETTWIDRSTPADDDLVIELQVANRGESDRVLKASMNHVDVDMSTPIRVRVESSSTATRTFRIPGGRRTLAGQSIALMLVEDDGPGRLRETIRVPDRATTALVDDVMSPE